MAKITWCLIFSGTLPWQIRPPILIRSLKIGFRLMILEPSLTGFPRDNAWYSDGYDSFSAISQRTNLLVAIKGLNKLKLTLSEDPLFHLRQLVLSLGIHARRRNLVRDEKRDQFINRLWDGISLFSSVVGNTVLCSLF